MANSTYLISSDQLIAENIFLSIGTKDILKGVTISASKGSITGLLGRNGSGKSTMLQCVFGTRAAAECGVFVNGVKVRSPYSRSGLLNYLPQRPFLPRQLTVRQVMQHYNTDTQIAFSYFPSLEEDMDRKISELSGGTERLVSVLILLLAHTRFTLLDEPFSHIMPLHIDQLRSLLLRQKEKKGIIVTDHQYRSLLSVSDNIYLMKEGKSIFIRDKADLVLHGYLNP